MEIEPDVFNLGVFELFPNLGHLVADSQLAALLVNQVDKVLLLVVCLSFRDVLFRSLERLIKIVGDSDRGRPGKVGLHLPKKRYGASDLQMTRDSKRPAGFLMH